MVWAILPLLVPLLLGIDDYLPWPKTEHQEANSVQVKQARLKKAREHGSDMGHMGF